MRPKAVLLQGAKLSAYEPYAKLGLMATRGACPLLAFRSLALGSCEVLPYYTRVLFLAVKLRKLSALNPPRAVKPQGVRVLALGASQEKPDYSRVQTERL